MSKRLLVVDDEPNLLVAVAACLRGEGYEVTTARGGREALVRLAQTMPDLIVSDIRMPGMDGYEVARALRSNSRTKFVPIIFLTAKDEREDRIAGFRTSVDAYLTKPFDPEELLAVVINIISRIERTSTEFAQMIGSIKGEETAASDFEFDEDFTESESRIARFVADGKSNKEIARELGLSVRTIEGHISNILSKKGWSNRVEIARHIIKRGSSA